MDRPTHFVSIEHAILSRRSVRAFAPIPVSRDAVEVILALASRAPSGSNVQPWRAHVLTGEPLRALTTAILDADEQDSDRYQEEFPYYPPVWVEPYRTRRKELGVELYRLVGVPKGDSVGMRRQHRRNFVVFDAPVLLVCTIERTMGRGAWVECGMFMQTAMLAARGHGLHSCPMAALNRYQPIIQTALQMPEQEVIVGVIALGHADETAIVNKLHAKREPVEVFAKFHGWPDGSLGPRPK